nr:TMV resistance protein N-like [Ipomoea batatas]
MATTTQIKAESSSNSQSTYLNHSHGPWEYHVYISFRGDTRKNFTDHLYSALCRAGINTFRDEEEVRKGKTLSSEFERAIQNSRISIIVFSKDYASSRWCLDELVEILKCKEIRNQVVLPIFYNVNPSQVAKQTGEYGTALARHKGRFGEAKGKPAVRFSKDEWGRLAEIEERVTLVGKFSKGRPPLELIREKFQSTFSLTGSAHVGSLDLRHILIRFSREDDCEKVLAKGLAMVAGKPMRLTRWSPDWSTRKESPLAAVWVDPEDGFWQRLEYENVPSFCSKCFKLGHVFSSCKSGSDRRNKSGEISGSGPVVTPKQSKKRSLKPFGLGLGLGVQTRSMRRKGHRAESIDNSLLPNSNSNTSIIPTLNLDSTENLQTQSPFLKRNQNTLPIVPLEETSWASIDRKSPNSAIDRNIVPFSNRARSSAKRALLFRTPRQYRELEGIHRSRVISRSKSELDDEMYEDDVLRSNEVTDLLVGFDYG